MAMVNQLLGGTVVISQRAAGSVRGEKSRMKREFHVRFCEGAGVQFPCATRLAAARSRSGGAGSVREGEEPKPDRKVGGVGRLQSTDEASNNTGRQVGGGERGGKAAGRREGEGQRMPRTQSRTRHVPDGPSPRTGTGWAAQAPNAGRV